MGLLRRVALIVATVTLIICAGNTVGARTAAPKPIVSEKSASASAIKPTPPKWLEICTRLAPVTSVLCSLAPLPTIVEASRTKSVGRLPLLPYSSMAANGFIWSLYGWLTDSAPVKHANVIGTVLGACYFREFTKYIPVGAAGLPGTIHQHLVALTWILLVNGVVVTRFPRKTAAKIVGNEAVVLYVLLFASPLVVLKHVLATKSAAAIPLPFTIASAINCSMWSLVGFFSMRDFYVTFPSVLGLLCAVAQLCLKGIYGGSAL